MILAIQAKMNDIFGVTNVQMAPAITSLSSKLTRSAHGRTIGETDP